MFARLGSSCFRRRRLVLALWLVGLLVIGGISKQVGGSFGQDFTLPGSDSTAGVDILDQSFGGLGAGAQGTVVFRADDGVAEPAVKAAMETYFTMLSTLAANPDVDVADDPAFASLDEATRAKLVKRAEGRAALAGATITSPYAPGAEHQVASQGEDAGKIAFANVELASDDFDEAASVAPILRDLAPHMDGLQVELGGQVFAEFAEPDSESLGLAFAIVILVVAFGSVLAMGLPIGVALAGIAGGSILVTFLSNVLSMPDFSPFLGGMIGLGVGIDYALFIVTRYRENLHHGHTPQEATSIAIDTAGRAVTFAGVTVVISFLGMVVMGVSFIQGLAVSAAVVVAMTVVASLTLLPALLGFAGERVEVTRWRGIIATGLVALGLLGTGLKIDALTVFFPIAGVVLLAGLAFKPLKREVPPRKQKPLKQTFAYRWSRVIQHHPWPAALGASVFLIVLSLPVLGLWLGFSDEGNYPEDTTTRQAYDLLVDGFGPGFNGPFVLVASVDGEKTPEQLQAVNDAVQADPNVAFVAPAFANSQVHEGADTTAYMWQVTPKTTPQSEETKALVHRLRDDVLPAAESKLGADVHVTGQVPGMSDFSDYLTSRMPYFFAAVLILSFLLLMAVFRSVLVPLKAVVMNLLSIGASYGIMVMLLNWGWGSDLTHLEPGPIETFAPMMLFAIVFGLSMDYEVFLLSRIKEEWHRTGDSHASVANGLAATARVITAAAAIMVVVFGSFLLEADRTFKLFGIGLATAIFLDATVVRMVLVPATMELLGDRNWWLPKWLDRIIPHIDVEGTPDEITDFDDPDEEPERELVSV